MYVVSRPWWFQNTILRLHTQTRVITIAICLLFSFWFSFGNRDREHVIVPIVHLALAIVNKFIMNWRNKVIGSFMFIHQRSAGIKKCDSRHDNLYANECLYSVEQHLSVYQLAISLRWSTQNIPSKSTLIDQFGAFVLTEWPMTICRSGLPLEYSIHLRVKVLFFHSSIQFSLIVHSILNPIIIKFKLKCSTTGKPTTTFCSAISSFFSVWIFRNSLFIHLRRCRHPIVASAMPHALHGILIDSN